ncbi:hypothetical protein [Mesorhizobium denitrificans]|uniref:Uncharacterized protein n=1 Tax=Mesorhizobium denitrificans TaxID=2294114 RepID=A0A371X6D6_9HYPH|nr:hypothetical protein [Mesorhizobium denitrificans]RFC64781.1 hypothetical protein DY251_18630 [Mesorhizobium denitrificans]
MRFVFPHSHAFPRGRVTVEVDGSSGPECLVEFGDGIAIIARWQRDGEQLDLHIPAYRTAKGTQVVAHDWRLIQRKDGGWRVERRDQ